MVLTNDLSGEIECSCEYPHGHDFEPPFESCTCEPECFHVVPLNLEALLEESRRTEEDFDFMDEWPTEEYT